MHSYWIGSSVTCVFHLALIIQDASLLMHLFVVNLFYFCIVFHYISKIQIIYLLPVGLFSAFCYFKHWCSEQGHDFWCTYPSVFPRVELQSHRKCKSSTLQDSAELLSNVVWWLVFPGLASKVYICILFSEVFSFSPDF